MLDERIDCLLHFAAESHVDWSISGPDDFVRTNVFGTHSLLKSARAVWSRDGRIARSDIRFHHVSTDEVYGSLTASGAPFTETSAYSPNSPYSASKASSDHLVRAYHHTFGLSVTTSNCSNNYGPFQFPEKLIPLCLLNALEGKPLPVYGRGENIRDWLCLEDHCRAMEKTVAWYLGNEGWWRTLLQGTVSATSQHGSRSIESNLRVVVLGSLFVPDGRSASRAP